MNRRSSRHGVTARPARTRRPKREPGAKRASYRIALKIAARTSIRSLGRSALIATMVALPIAGLAGIGVVYASGEPTNDEVIATQLGQNEASLRLMGPPGDYFFQNPTGDILLQHTGGYVEPTGDLQHPAEAFPAGTRILPLFDTLVTATTATGLGSFRVIEGPSWDAAFSGVYDVIEGRTPRTDREVMVTASLLSRLGVEVGDSVDLRSSAQVDVTVVGLLDCHNCADATELFFAREGSISGTTASDHLQEATFYLPDLELDWADVQRLNQEGLIAVSRSVLLDPPPLDSRFTTNTPSFGKFIAIFAVVAIGGVFAAFEVVLLAGAAFTVTARQQQRTLATLASVGSPRKLLFRVLAANGIVLGAVGAIPGIIVGIGAAAAFMTLTSNGSATQYYGFHVPWPALAGFAVFATVIGWLASLVPARNASRFDIVAALRSSRKPPPPSKRKPIAGLVMLLVGVGSAIVGGTLMAVLIQAGRSVAGGHPLLWLPIVMLVVGPVLAQVGLILCSPLVLRMIARAMSRAGIGARLASRDAARNPSRAVPALAAIMTTVFVAVFAMSMVSAGQESAKINHQYGLALGQVAVSLSYTEFDDEARTVTFFDYERDDEVKSALRSTIDVADLRVLAAAHSVANYGPEYEIVGQDPNAEIPVPVIPEENLCPFDRESPEYTPALEDPSSREYRNAENDWRCQSGYHNAGGPGSRHLMVGDAADLALVLNREPSAAARQVLENGGAVSLNANYVFDGEFRIEWWAVDEMAEPNYRALSSPIRVETLDAVLEEPEHPISFGVFISRETANRLSIDYRDVVVLASTVTTPDVAQTDALSEALTTLPGSPEIYPQIETGPDEFAEPWMWGLLGLAALIAIAAASVAIGLARFDGRQDDATLGALGARRLVRKNFAFWQGVIIAGIGTVLGAGMGLVPAIALSANPEIPLALPWLQIGLTAVVVPLFIACGSWVFATGKTITARRMSIA